MTRCFLKKDRHEDEYGYMFKFKYEDEEEHEAEEEHENEHEHQQEDKHNFLLARLHLENPQFMLPGSLCRLVISGVKFRHLVRNFKIYRENEAKSGNQLKNI